jgi:calcineurin-like phosphoesterase family protein
MANTFFTSDTHFGHEALCTKFTKDDGSPARDFPSHKEMDEHMIKQWNSVVRDCDTVYHLGDVVIKKNFMFNLIRLNGKKRLVRGNHDIFDDQEYHRHFKRLLGVKMFPNSGVVATHVPVHPCQLEYRWKLNVHGHMHHHLVLDKFGKPDLRYFNVCGEHHDYVPVSLDVLQDRIKNNT